MPADLAQVGVKNTFIDVAEFAPPETTELRRAQTCPEKPKRVPSGIDLPMLAEEEELSPQSQVVTPKIPGLTTRSLSTSNFVEDNDGTPDATPVHSPEPWGECRFSERTQKGPTSPRFAATPDQTPLVAPMETQLACRQLLASFEKHFGGPMVLDQPMQMQPANTSPPSSMPSSPEPMMQQQPLQQQPMQMQTVQMQPMQMQQPMQQQQQPMMMMMPVVKLQGLGQQNNSPQYPDSFQNANQMQNVPLHQMGYPTYPPMNGSAPNRTPPVPGEHQELDVERAKWKQMWEAEESKARWAEWEDDYAHRRPRRRRTRRVEPVAPESGCKVFVGGLGPMTTSLTLRAYFAQYGRVLDAAVLADSETKRSRGFGFVDFAGEIPAAVLEQEHVIEQRRCGVRKYEYTPQGMA
jgi:hypothetical protein